ncbi:MAG: TIGR03936 family radical SAM-associated protein [Oscillospiraceae bacterium]|nr:TIGR03936 family radical SAM-associated protein [Oscillospiraceae bacterium]
MTTHTPIRLRFSRTGAVRFTSHLDTCRILRSAFVRAGLDLRYSEGFNPHPKMTIAIPLPLGHESLCELCDIGITGEVDGENYFSELAAKLSAALPSGFQVSRAYVPSTKSAGIHSLSYQITLHTTDQNAAEKINSTAKETAPLIVEKTTKKGGVKQVDIRPAVFELKAVAGEDCVLVTARLAASGERYLKPELLLSALCDRCEITATDSHIIRTEVHGDDGGVFM